MAFNTSDTVTPVSELNADLGLLTRTLGQVMVNDTVDARGGLNTQQAIDEYYEMKLRFDDGVKTTSALFYFDGSLTLPAEFWMLKARFKSVFYYDVSGQDNPSLPDIPDLSLNPTPVERISFNIMSASGSFGEAGIDDIPTTWRNLTRIRLLAFERQELTSAQQVGIVQGIERELAAGMSSLYTVTTTTTRIIDFQSTSSGANGGLIQADLVALGWSIVNATQMDKTINGFRWRVLHNAV